MFFDGFFGHLQDDCDVGVGLALGDPEQHLCFAFRESENEEGLVGAEIGIEAVGSLRGLEFGAMGLVTGQSHADGGQQILLGDGFGQVIISTPVHALSNVHLVAFGGEKDEGEGCCGGRCPEGAQDSMAIHVGHHHITNHQIGCMGLDGFETETSVFGDDGFESLHLKDERQVAAHLGMILDDDNLVHGVVAGGAGGWGAVIGSG